MNALSKALRKRRRAKLPKLRWITRGGIVYIRRDQPRDEHASFLTGTRLSRHRYDLYIGDPVSVVVGQRVQSMLVAAYSRANTCATTTR